MYARLHITTSVVYGTLEKSCQRTPLTQWLHQLLVQDWLIAMPFGWNIRGKPQQTTVCPETRVVTGTRRRDHISPVLADLYWLPKRARITYKIATLVFKIREVNLSRRIFRGL